MDKRKAAGEATRTKLIDAARELFQAHGYEAVTMRMLAKHIGMSTGAVFAQFENKAVLFEAAVGHPAPDVPAFLLRVAHDAPETVLAVDAMILRGDLVGHSG